MAAEKTIRLVSPRGFCAGVRGAVRAFEETEKKYSRPIYVLNELVHNRQVGNDMKEKGAVFVSSLLDVPPGSVVLFGAHGVGKAEEHTAAQRNLTVIDAGCPRVKKLHKAAQQLSPDEELIVFGNPAHPEVRGVIGHAGTGNVFVIDHADDIPDLPEMQKPTLLCQTTRDHLEIENMTRLLRQRYPHLHAVGGVCDAVFRRQQAVEQMIPLVDVMIIVGSSHSSNANRMRDVSLRMGKEAFLIDSPEELPDLSGFNHIGLGAGASTPDEAVRNVLQRLLELGYTLL